MAKSTGKLHFVDAITTLKRSMDHRLRQLRLTYKFDTIPIATKPRRILEQLAYFDIVRPIMLEQLILMRNQIEHADVDPPDNRRCAEFLDFIWYFLRSTDKLVRNTPTTIVLYPPEEGGVDSERWIEVETEPDKKWEIKVRGIVASPMLSKHEIKSWLLLEVEKTGRRKELPDYHLNRKGKLLDMFFTGKVKEPQEGIRGIISHYFRSF